eukprot:CAMPEP_0172394064 /NCGR_PEP_ID=MMETSP1061-20121228/13322_1 /TAXON_ID=37318 /ORGANISM="Pseudo-nitzschia pungens, Strain cf. pungens" /LENGTH=380 /DNA_ID=CAMNT_0013125335 /DNA_START=165 /DNA_END=1307 /DNA_ORIENTATION=+
MKPHSGSSSTLSVHVQKVLVVLVGTIIIHNRAVDAYVSAPLSSLAKNGSGNVGGRGLETATTEHSLKRSRNLMRLYSNDGSGTGSDFSDSKINNAQDGPLPSLFVETDASSTTMQEASFGDVMPISKKSFSSTSAEFGDVVSISRPPAAAQSAETTSSASVGTADSAVSDKELLRQRRTRNIGVAILSVFLAVGNYAYQWTHPVTPIQLLVNMERSSAPLSEIGRNSKPTVIDFWAPWCENCRYMAPTLFQVEESYKDKVNFVMVNGDDPNNWPLIEALGVDAIPHLAMIESDGTVDTALIGAVPKEWLSRDIDVLLDNAQNKVGAAGCSVEIETVEIKAEPENCGRKSLPYQMLDVFANRRPEDRKLSNLDAIFEARSR